MPGDLVPQTEDLSCCPQASAVLHARVTQYQQGRLVRYGQFQAVRTSGLLALPAVKPASSAPVPDSLLGTVLPPGLESHAHMLLEQRYTSSVSPPWHLELYLEVQMMARDS